MLLPARVFDCMMEEEYIKSTPAICFAAFWVRHLCFVLRIEITHAYPDHFRFMLVTCGE